MNDRDRARDDLLVALISSRTAAARIRAVLDSSEFADHAPLAMLVADHDLRHPEAPEAGPARLDSLRAHVDALVDTGRRHEGRSGIHRSRVEDPRWALAEAARADLFTVNPAPAPLEGLDELLATFTERRDGRRPPEVPGPATRNRQRRRATD